jgi:hypothetical protein
MVAHRKCEIKKPLLPPETSASESAAGLMLRALVIAISEVR